MSQLPASDSRATIKSATTVFLLLFALFLSGLAAIVNQTVWQRALKVYVAGSEAISSMIVVLVFMLGLGLGSHYMGRVADRVGNPLRLLGVVELLLCGVNLLIAFLLCLQIGESVHSLQRLAVSAGVPLRLLYAAISTGVLLGPCFLMGITMPLVSEVAQRQLGWKESRFLTVLFFLNTLGAVAGCVASGFYLMPYFGQQRSLIFAASFNALASLIVMGLALAGRRTAGVAPSAAVVSRTAAGLRPQEVMGFLLGFLALAYEMYLLRVTTLAYEPLPYTFSTVLCFYLLLWSIGVFLARRRVGDLSALLGQTAIAVMVVPLLFHLRFWGGNVILFSLIYALPCVWFGLLFGRLVAAVAVHWGNDVGRFYALNTLGCCLGIFATTLVGYRVHYSCIAWGIGFGYVALWVYERWLSGCALRSAARGGVLVPVLVSGIWLADAGLHWRDNALAGTADYPSKTYFSCEGVVEVRGGREMFWDGLWHSRLTRGDHPGTINWLLAVLPLMSHAHDTGKDALVIGLGTGITAATLARSRLVKSVDVYEINPKLSELMADYPDGTLGVGRNQKVHMLWQDARVGLVLNDKRYDLITQQPLYLKQAGSSILLSKEYMQMIRKRMKPGGVFCIYSNSLGNAGQSLVVRRTAREVFRFGESFLDGYLLVVSDEPFEFTAISIAAKLGRLPSADFVAQEVRAIGVERLAACLDRPLLDWLKCPVFISDDRPIVEYPDIAGRVVSDYQRRLSRKP